MMQMNIIDTSQLQTNQPLRDPRQLMAGMSDPSSDIFKAKARERAEEFEAIFIAQMFKPMMESIPTDGLMGGGNSEHMFRSMMVDEIGKDIAKQGGIGLSDSIYREIIRMQEA